jgi:hypothetical protein
VRAATKGILRYTQRGELARRQSFAVHLAERLPTPADPVDVLLEEADADGDSWLERGELPNLETLGLAD